MGALNCIPKDDSADQITDEKLRQSIGEASEKIKLSTNSNANGAQTDDLMKADPANEELKDIKQKLVDEQAKVSSLEEKNQLQEQDRLAVVEEKNQLQEEYERKLQEKNEEIEKKEKALTQEIEKLQEENEILEADKQNLHEQTVKYEQQSSAFEESLSQYNTTEVMAKKSLSATLTKVQKGGSGSKVSRFVCVVASQEGCFLLVSKDISDPIMNRDGITDVFVDDSILSNSKISNSDKQRLLVISTVKKAVPTPFIFSTNSERDEWYNTIQQHLVQKNGL